MSQQSCSVDQWMQSKGKPTRCGFAAVGYAWSLATGPHTANGSRSCVCRCVRSGSHCRFLLPHMERNCIGPAIQLCPPFPWAYPRIPVTVGLRPIASSDRTACSHVNNWKGPKFPFFFTKKGKKIGKDPSSSGPADGGKS